MLRPYQEIGRDYLRSRQKALLTDDPGLGKTIQALSALNGEPVNVVCPASVCSVWEREAAKWAPSYSVTVIKNKREWRYATPGEIVICNPEKWPTPTMEMVKSMPQSSIWIADEAHAFKNPTSQRTKKWRYFVAYATMTGGKAWGLTGTPLLNSPLDLWGLLNSFDLAKTAFGNWQNFVYLFRGYQGTYGWEFGLPREGVEKNLFKVMMGRRKSSVLAELPPKVYETYNVDLSERILSRIENGMDVSSVQTLINMKGFDFTKLATWRRELALLKAEALHDRLADLEQEGSPLVVFSVHKCAVESIAARDGWVSLTGESSPEERANAVALLQEKKVKGIAGTIGAMGVGLTLTSANRCIFVDRDWTPALNKQAEDRLHRMGQTNNVVITDVVTNSAIDRLVTESLLFKQEQIDESVERARYDS